MKHLRDIINESILDNGETLEQTAENNIYRHALGLHYKSWRVENKILIYDGDKILDRIIRLDASKDILLKSRLGESKDIQLRSQVDWTYTQLKEVQNVGLKFEPLVSCIIDDTTEQHPNTWLSILPCDKIGAIRLTIFNKDIDFTKFNGEIKHMIQFVPSDCGTTDAISVTPPKYHVGVVHFKSLRHNTMKYKKIAGWDCDYLIVDGEGYKQKNYLIDSDETICGFYKNQLQALITNNPKAKEIYIYDDHAGCLWRCSCKGIGKSRKLFDLTNRTIKYVEKLLIQYENKCKQL